MVGHLTCQVFQGKGYGVEVDLWSLGIMLFEFVRALSLLHMSRVPQVCGYLPFGTNLVEPCLEQRSSSHIGPEAASLLRGAAGEAEIPIGLQGS